MNGPLVSVGLQFFNNETTLYRAIRSIFTQTYQNWELILHNDGSQDHSLQVARSFDDSRVKLFTDAINRKRPFRLNESLHVAMGKYYAVMDGDDVSYPDRLSKQVKYLEEHSYIDLLGGAMIVFDQTGRPIGKRQPPTIHEEICAKPWAGFPLAQPTFMGRIDWFRKHFYDCRAIGAVEDQDLLLRTYQSSRFANLQDILVGYRETGLYLKKILIARYFFSRSLFRQFRPQRNPILRIRAILEQCAKLTFDCLAIGTALDYRILKHRARPITDEEQQDWANVWKLVNC